MPASLIKRLGEQGNTLTTLVEEFVTVSIQPEERDCVYPKYNLYTVTENVIGIYGAREFVDKRGNELGENYIAFYTHMISK